LVVRVVRISGPEEEDELALPARDMRPQLLSGLSWVLEWKIRFAASDWADQREGG